MYFIEVKMFYPRPVERRVVHQFTTKKGFDMSMNILAAEIIEINTANGWNVLKPEQWDDTCKIPAILALIHSEVSEALEGFRKGDKVNFSEEMAEVLIRVLDCTGGLEIDIDAAVRAKLEKNKTRGFRHGGKRV
jgi:NTP pyrophosphatase (non-canonical NTP hydrolase)